MLNPANWIRTLCLIAMLSLWLLLPGTAFAQEGENGEDEGWQPPIPIDGSNGGVMALSYLNRLAGTLISPAREVPDFSLPATTGDSFSFEEQGGQVVFVYFGYLTCPDVCPTTLADLMRAYREVGEPENIQVVFITIDPERDSLTALERYVGAFHERFVGLRPESEESLQALTEVFDTTYERREVESSVGYLMDHSATVYMVAPDGRILTQYPFGVPYSDYATDMQVMMDYTLSGSTADLSSRPPVYDESREYRIVIPEGTGDQIQLGQDPGIIPLKIELTLGERDVLVLENHDHSDYLVGGIWVAPHETVYKQFKEPQTFVGLCTVTVGRDLVEIIVSEAPTEN